MPLQDQLSLREAADALGVHYMTVYRYVRLGVLPAQKTGSVWHVTSRDLASFRERASATCTDGSNVAPWDRRLEARLVAGDHSGSWAVVEAALAAGSSARDVYTDILTPALRSIGDRWASGDIGIATEHCASGIAHRIMGRLSQHMVKRGRSRGTVVIGTPPGEHHFLPVTMLADLLRGEGFEVKDLGCDLPVDAFVAGAGDADRLVAIAISATTPDQDEAITATVAALRSGYPAVPILLGGGAVHSLEHARTLGADGWAADAAAGLDLFASLTAAHS